MNLIPAELFLGLTLVSERQGVGPVLDHPGSLCAVCLQDALSKTSKGEKSPGVGEQCHNPYPAGLDYQPSEVYPPAAPVSHYKSSS